MGLVLSPAQDAADPETTEVEERRRRLSNQQSYFVGCCYTPRKQGYRNSPELRVPPRYRVLSMSRPPGQSIDSGSDSDSLPEGNSSSRGAAKKRVRFPSQRSLFVMHEMIEDGEEWADSRRSDDIDFSTQPEKIENVRKMGDPEYKPELPTLTNSSALARRAAARTRKKASKTSQVAQDLSSAPPPRPGQRWTSHELEVWNPAHIREVIKELFQKHDVQNRGHLSWEDREVMPFVEDFFQAHGCSMPDLPQVVFSTAYEQVKIDKEAPEGTSGLDVEDMCDFAKRVYDIILQEASRPEVVVTTPPLPDS